ncbi:Multidrug resistance protein mexB Multidrug-efflux transporter mexB [Salmonella enterica subsp. enterica]|uniref:Multidrug resistance protein mexB Multidrug-efflux transporter mexB n=1 Tax=Salmonella enterica I TaxID=59201 RepID=A0A379W5C5_SALET|nr:Multidrug resistance protein mexB Multidrug-efflux transporter mexB [Salmonella enterica subsp. enterica]
MANFFIDRPIFAWVLAILLCLTGALAIFSLPVEHIPIWRRPTYVYRELSGSVGANAGKYRNPGY